MRKIDTSITAVGLALFIFVATKIGWVEVVRQLEAIPFALLILIGLSFLRLILQTRAWATALRAEGIPHASVELIGIRLAAQALGYVSVLGPAVSEPMKLRFLRKHKGNATSATLADSSVYGFSSALVGIAGCVCAGLVLSHGRRIVPSVVLAVVFAIGLLLIGLRKPLLTPVVRRLSLRCPRWLRKGEQIEIAIRQFRIRHHGLIRRMFWLDLGCQLLMAAEVAAVFWALQLPVHAGTILALEAASRAVKMMAGWMPARIGADETGTVAAFAALGLPSSSGLTLALARRVRDLLVCVLGFTWLVWKAKRSGERSHGDGLFAAATWDTTRLMPSIPAEDLLQRSGDAPDGSKSR